MFNIEHVKYYSIYKIGTGILTFGAEYHSFQESYDYRYI